MATRWQVLCESEAMLSFFILFCILNVSASNVPTCTVRVDGCQYEMESRNKPVCGREQQTSSANFLSRKVRSAQTLTPNNSLAVIGKKLGKLERRLNRAMEELSTRVLRGVRRMESKVSDLIGHQAKRHVNQGVQVCPIGFVVVDNWPSCYLFSSFNTSWYEARDYCAAFESDLVSIGIVREHYLIAFLIRNHPDYSRAMGWWTSGSFVSKTRQWMWTSDIYMKPFTFIKWAPNEPNETAAQCMRLSRDSYQLWSDDVCTEHYNFICEVTMRTL